MNAFYDIFVFYNFKERGGEGTKENLEGLWGNVY